MRVRSDHRDGFDFRSVEGEKTAGILEEHHPFPRGLKRRARALDVVVRRRVIRDASVEPAEARLVAQEPPNFVVDRGLRDLALLQRRREQLRG